MLAVAALAVHIEMKSACRHLALNRGFVYRDRSRHRAVSPLCTTRAATTHPLALSSAEQDRLIGVLDSERFADIAPAHPCSMKVFITARSAPCTRLLASQGL
jgi:hypothetical protein